MHKHYIINGLVEFHPAASTLRDLNNPDRVVVLNSPAGRCLLLLIERVGSIVTQQECMDIVWQRRGMLVSPNTYYQNISILRKGLKKVGFETDPIVTIPRIGLTLASDTQITVKETQPQADEEERAAPDLCEETVAPTDSTRRFWLPGALRFNIARKIELAIAHLHREAVPVDEIAVMQQVMADNAHASQHQQ
ncbi:winged helix-turn-helix domain-containing protein [Enterobacter asburiae]|uniref:winged helix-turn-helix domain-containing protein n=1 Tax=Enterobacter asburiae TaxID=61645 RepID=UPI000B150BA5|nr:winged helix-turn-helix domain-containing protein [Enterobacter asburiae]